jgi:hypothetical protein
MVSDLGRIVINEMSDAMMRDPPELRPIPQRAHGGFLAGGKYPAQAKADYVSELISNGGSWFHFHAFR